MDLPLSIGGFSCSESVENFRITLGDTDSSALRRLYCHWGDAPALADYLRGSTVDAGGITVTTPKQPHPTVGWLYVDTVGITPYGRALGATSWDYAQVDVSYKNLAYASNSDTLQDISIDVSGEDATMSKDGWQFDTEDGDPINLDVHKLVSTLTVTITKYKQAVNPLGTMTALLNKVNSGPFNLLGYSIPAYTALYMGGSVQQRITTGTALTYDVSHKVVISPYDMRSGNQINDLTGNYDPIIHKISGDYLYETASFAGLSF